MMEFLYSAGYEGVEAHLATLILAEQAAMTSISDTKLIPLTQGKFAIVDTEDYEWLNLWKWHYAPAGYAARKHKFSGVYKYILMLRVLLNPPNNLLSDHINGNGLDNRRSNLRICTNQQNQFNQKSRRGKSRYKGVHFHKPDQKWCASIWAENRRINLGYFFKESDAAKAYNEASLKYHGEFANLNQIGE